MLNILLFLLLFGSFVNARCPFCPNDEEPISLPFNISTEKGFICNTLFVAAQTASNESDCDGFIDLQTQTECGCPMNATTTSVCKGLCPLGGMPSNPNFILPNNFGETCASLNSLLPFFETNLCLSFQNNTTIPGACGCPDIEPPCTLCAGNNTPNFRSDSVRIFCEQQLETIAFLDDNVTCMAEQNRVGGICGCPGFEDFTPCSLCSSTTMSNPNLMLDDIGLTCMELEQQQLQIISNDDTQCSSFQFQYAFQCGCPTPPPSSSNCTICNSGESTIPTPDVFIFSENKTCSDIQRQASFVTLKCPNFLQDFQGICRCPNLKQPVCTLCQDGNPFPIQQREDAGFLQCSQEELLLTQNFDNEFPIDSIDCQLYQTILGTYCGCSNTLQQQQQEEPCRLCGNNKSLPEPFRMISTTAGPQTCATLELLTNLVTISSSSPPSTSSTCLSTRENFGTDCCIEKCLGICPDGNNPQNIDTNITITTMNQNNNTNDTIMMTCGEYNELLRQNESLNSTTCMNVATDFSVICGCSTEEQPSLSPSTTMPTTTTTTTTPQPVVTTPSSNSNRPTISWMMMIISCFYIFVVV